MVKIRCTIAFGLQRPETIIYQSGKDNSMTENKQSLTLQEVITSLGVNVIDRHIFLCCDQTKPKCSGKTESLESWNFLKKRLTELHLTGQGGI